jgi:hypothetical protein
VSIFDDDGADAFIWGAIGVLAVAVIVVAIVLSQV